MSVDELNRNELIELKQHYYCERNNNVSYGELANIDELVSDYEICQVYGNIEFTEEDFFVIQIEMRMRRNYKCLNFK